jgi:N12 class adenine-specific DNA methylase
MTEMFTMQRYLQHDRLNALGLLHFDSWASIFGETQTSIELAPEGTGYRARTRFAKFHNLPEVLCCRGGLKETLLKQHGSRPSVAILARLQAA